MSTDFYASYISGALGICIGNRLDVMKTELQAGNRHFVSSIASSLSSSSSAIPTTTTTTTTTGGGNHNEILTSRVVHWSRLTNLTNLFRGAAAPILGYGALNSLLFMTYNRSLIFLDPSIPNHDVTKLAGVDLGKIWISGALGGWACWIVSTPVEVIKCRAQLMVDHQTSSYATVKDVWNRHGGIRGFYRGGTITSLRDSFGYAWYFWTYELSKRLLLSRQPDPFKDPEAKDILIAGGIAGVVTWASIYPLDVVKTRLQTQSGIPLLHHHHDRQPLLTASSDTSAVQTRSSWSIAKVIARTEGIKGFYRGLGICSLRAFIVNAVGFYAYESLMVILNPSWKR